ncbi:MAG: hypothetical protein ACFFD5_10250 [Candidatus Thorarchaeota archaeon]
MSEEELRDEINIIAQNIMKVEEVAKKKEDYIKNKVNLEYNPKISEIELKLDFEGKRLDEISKNINKLTIEKNQSISVLKSLKKEYNVLKKEREKLLSKELKAITTEKKTKMKDINQKIKSLEKKLKEKEQ